MNYFTSKSSRDLMLVVFFLAALAGHLLLFSDVSSAKQDFSVFKNFDERTAIEAYADEVEAFPQESLVTLRGNARVVYKDNTLRADEIVLDLGQGEMRANRNVLIWSEGQQLHGERLIYDLRTSKATLISSEWQESGFQIRGDETAIEHKKSEINVKNAWITSCDMIDPHYHLETEQAKVVLGKRLWTRNTFFYLGNLPVMYLPYFSRSLYQDWKGHVISYTYSTQRGFGFLNKYDLHFDPMRRIALYADWYPSYGLGIGFKETYHKKGDMPMDGKFYAYRLNLFGNKDDLNDNVDYDSRYKIAGEHRQELNEDLTLTAKYQKLSDREFNDDLRNEEEMRDWTQQELRSNRNSFMNLAYTKPDYNLRLLVKENLNNFQLGELMEDERSPEIRWEERRQLIPGLPIYRKLHLDFSKLGANQEFSEQEDDLFRRRYDQVDRLDFGMDFESPFTVWQWLRINPFVGYQSIYYNNPRQEWSLRNARGNDFDVSNPIDDPDDRDFLLRWDETYYDKITQSIKPGWEYSSHWDNVLQNVGKAGVEFSTRMVSPLGSTRRFSQMRLVMEPTVVLVGYGASKDLDDEIAREFGEPGYPTDPPSGPKNDLVPRLPQIDEVDELRRSANIIRTGMDFKLEGKDYENVTQRLAKLSIFAGRNIKAGSNQDRYEDLVMEMSVTPNQYVGFTHYWRYDLDDRQTNVVWDGLTLTPNENLSCILGYSQFTDPHTGIGDETYADVGMDVRMSQKWLMEFREQYDLQRSLARETRCRFVRDLHDWDASLTIRDRNRLYSQNDFQVTLAMHFKLPNPVAMQSSALREKYR